MTGMHEAYVSWSAIAEPADPIASWLVAAMGAERALEWLREAASDRVRGAMALAPLAPRHQADAVVKASEKWIARIDVADPEPHLERAHKVGARVLTPASKGWPQALSVLGAAEPLALWVRGSGDVDRMLGASIAVVGARSSTSYGDHMAADLGAGLTDRGWHIVSGGAYGIDASAHRGALAAGGATMAIMAGGVDRFYPAGNADLLASILDSGVVMSEVPPGYAPHRARFLSRNRLIAAASATVVVEAAMRSGALSTARHAAELARPLGAVPGPVTSAASSGCHHLIRDSLAVLVSSVDDAAELAGPIGASLGQDTNAPSAADASNTGGARPDFDTAQQRQAFDALSSRESTLEQVARGAGLTLEDTRIAVGALELLGHATRAGAGWRRT